MNVMRTDDEVAAMSSAAAAAGPLAQAEQLRRLREQVERLERTRPTKLRRRRGAARDLAPASGAGPVAESVDLEVCDGAMLDGAGLDGDSSSACVSSSFLSNSSVSSSSVASAAFAGGSSSAAGEVVSTGCGALDRLLAGGGLERGSLVEWLSGGRGVGGATLAWLAACEAARDGGGIVVVDRQRRFYPPAAVAWGVDPAALAVVRVERDEDELWVVDQALRSSAVAAVWLYRDELNSRDFRRWQLAAERGGTLGLLVRPARVLGEPTWADVRWQVRTSGGGASAGGGSGGAGRRTWRVSVELVRCRGGGAAGERRELEWDDLSGKLVEAPRSARQCATR